MSTAERSEADGLPGKVTQGQQTVVAPDTIVGDAPPRTLEAHVRSLQRSAGNRAVSDLLRSGRLGGAAHRDLARAPTRVSFNISEPRVGGGTYGTHAGFDVDIDGNEIVVTQKVRLIPDRDVTPAEVTAVKSAAESAFLSMWDNRFIFTDASRNEQLFLRVRVQWVTSRAHNSVRLHMGQGRMNSRNWVTGTTASPVRPIRYAHELSHLMGLLDEYQDATAVNRRTATSSGVHEDHSLMGDYPNEGYDTAEVKLRHGQKVADRVGRALRPRRHFTASFTGPAQGERLVRWRNIRDAAAADTPERTRAAAEVTAIEADLLIPELSTTAGVAYAPTR
jgi:hypothetical protein